MAGLTGLRGGGRQHSGTCSASASTFLSLSSEAPLSLSPGSHLSPKWLWGSCQVLGLLKSQCLQPASQESWEVRESGCHPPPSLSHLGCWGPQGSLGMVLDITSVTSVVSGGPEG